MTESVSRPRRGRARGARQGWIAARAALAAGVLAGAIGALVIGPAGAASASLGSVPAEVSAYVADGGMIARLADVYGKNAAGAGLDVDDTTKAGPISRVYEWTAARLAGATTDHPVQLTNNWVVPVTIAGKPVGLATIWINPQSVEPELADFTATPRLATALAEVPAAAALVRDPVTGAWLALQSGTVTPLVAGSSGLTGPVPVSSLTLSASAAPAAVPATPNPALGIAIGAVGLVVVVIVVALLVPRRRRAAAVEPESVAEPEPAVEPVVEPELELEPVAAPAPKPRPRAKASTPVTKPTVSKPGGRSPAGATASTKPPVAKPPVQKPPAQKPRPRKPPTPPDDSVDPRP